MSNQELVERRFSKSQIIWLNDSGFLIVCRHGVSYKGTIKEGFINIPGL